MLDSPPRGGAGVAGGNARAPEVAGPRSERRGSCVPRRKANPRERLRPTQGILGGIYTDVGVFDLEVAFFGGALVGAAIHGSLAIWYTRRQRRIFERDTDRKLILAQNAILDRVKVEVVPMITGSVGGRLSAEVRAARQDLAEKGASPEDAEDLAALESAFGKKRARQIVLGDKLLSRVRERRLRQRGGAPNAPAPAPTPENAPGAPPRAPGDLKPEIVAALERAGFKRSPAHVPDRGADAGAEASGGSSEAGGDGANP